MTDSSASTSAAPANRHALTSVEKQRAQLEKLLKDPSKPAYIPPPPKEKNIRPAREMMKNVQGSSAGAGSGEFHVYKASRRREYERLKLLEEASHKEIIEEEFERKRREAEEIANAKTAKNRAKRQKKKERSKMKGPANDDSASKAEGSERSELPIKKRRLADGEGLIFKKPGETSDDESEVEEVQQPKGRAENQKQPISAQEAPAVLETTKIMIVEDD
ncbi:unnamed protein product [Cyclocybe aegerita]|uniref:DUF1168-domain-containing protein n=1 Tax=Cyclocybe aegerita TaxID=1973307 RepID=A0A8S0WNJ6_CYCAE|nr:unnamed protein product [Cyclocybe aegerita]